MEQQQNQQQQPQKQVTYYYLKELHDGGVYIYDYPVDEFDIIVAGEHKISNGVLRLSGHLYQKSHVDKNHKSNEIEYDEKYLKTHVITQDDIYFKKEKYFHFLWKKYITQKSGNYMENKLYLEKASIQRRLYFTNFFFSSGKI